MAPPPIPACVLHLPRVSSSISFRAYKNYLGSQSVLRWWLGRFAAYYPAIPLYVLSSNPSEAPEIEQQVAGAEAMVIIADWGTRLRRFASIADKLKCDSIAFVGPGFAFAPRGLLSLAANHHAVQGNNCTLVTGFPAGSTPEIYSASLLIQMAEMNLPGIPLDPAQAVERLLWTGRTTGVEIPFRLVARPFDAASAYGSRPQDLPERIALETPRDLEIARHVIEDNATESSDSLADYKRWRQATIDLRARVLQQLRVDLPPVRRNSLQCRPVRVLYVSTPAGFSGAEESLCQMISQLDKRQFKASAVLGAEGFFAERLRRIGVEVFSPNVGLGASSVENLLYLMKVYDRADPDLVHINAASGNLPVLVSALKEVPIVSHFRVSELHRYEEQLRAADLIIAVSEFAKRQVLRLEIPEERVEVIYDEVDTRFFSPNHFDRAALP